MRNESWVLKSMFHLSLFELIYILSGADGSFYWHKVVVAIGAITYNFFQSKKLKTNGNYR